MNTINIKQFLLAMAIMCLSPWAGAVTYTYDNLNRLVSATYPSVGTIVYSYDAAGNRLSLLQTPVILPPTATTTAASSIGTSGATINGNVSDNGATTTVTFDYGLTTAYLSGNVAATTGGTVGAGAGSTLAAKTIGGLSCNTPYHFRVNGVNSAGTTNGSDLSFTTSACVPTATTTTASSVTATGATLNGNINANGASTAVTFDYGPTTGYGTNTAATPATVAALAGSTVALPISGLNCNAIYHFRVKGVNSAGTTYGNDLSFTTSTCPTLPGTPTLNAVAFGRGSAAVSFTPAISGGIATTYTATCTAVGHPTRTGSGAGSPVTVFGLTGGVVYSCSVSASNSAGSSGASAVMLVTPLKGPNITPILMLLLD